MASNVACKLSDQSSTVKAQVSKHSEFKNWITADGSSGFPAEVGRYHLYIGLACPYALRAYICHTLKGLEDVISCTTVDWMLTDKGWPFTDKKPKCSLDTVNSCQYLREVYALADPAFREALYSLLYGFYSTSRRIHPYIRILYLMHQRCLRQKGFQIKFNAIIVGNTACPNMDNNGLWNNGRITVPALWDKRNKTIVSNNSTDILRMLTREFNEFCKTDEQRNIDLYPADMADEINTLNAWIHPEIATNLLKAGFAKTQQVYDEGAVNLFKGLDKVEIIVSKQRYLTGGRLTEADISLFSILAMFDMIPSTYLKCNKKRIVDYPKIWGYTRDIYQTGGIADTVDGQHIQGHYQDSYHDLNPYGIVAIGPDIDFTAPHNRENM